MILIIKFGNKVCLDCLESLFGLFYYMLIVWEVYLNYYVFILIMKSSNEVCLDCLESLFVKFCCYRLF